MHLIREFTYKKQILNVMLFSTHGHKSSYYSKCQASIVLKWSQQLMKNTIISTLPAHVLQAYL